MPEIYLYAELLLHIKQLTLHATLLEPKEKGSQVFLSTDKKVISVVHDDQTASIYLPTQIKGTANITFPTERRTDFSVKLQLDDLNEIQEVLDASPGVQVPWTASALGTGVTISCKSCKTVLVQPEKITEWKDLPSENWAELMDLWFCHKPHEHHHDDSKAAESKGFSAQSKLINDAGTGLVDTLSLLIHSDDSSATQDDPDASDEKSLDLVCPECKAFVGSQNDADSSHRLWKSRLSLKLQSADDASFDSSVFIAAQLLLLIETSISRRVVVHDNTGNGLLCWIFNPDIYYSSSKRGPTVHRAAKVFYKQLDDALQVLDENSNTVEELALPTPELSQLQRVLEESMLILPQAARTFQEWQVGLLDRYEKNPSGLGAMDQNALNHPAGEIELFKLPPGWDALYE